MASTSTGRTGLAIPHVGDLELIEGWFESDSHARARFAFAVTMADGAVSSSMVYGEIAPGDKIPPHTHSCEEILYIVEGEAEAVVGDERAPASNGGIVLVPAFARHYLENVGSETLRQVGFYTSGVVIHTFDEPLMPMGQKVLLSPQLEVQ